MNKNINFKRILAIIGLVSIFVPTSLSVVACGTPVTENYSDVITKINEIKDLKINIANEDSNATVFDVLSNSEKGLAAAIAKHDLITFKQNLFKIDFTNIYTDWERNNRVTPDQLVKLTTYYFQFTYGSSANYQCLPVTITNREKEVVSEINRLNYGVEVVVKTSVKKFEEKIDFKFIKSEINSEIQTIFDDTLFELNEITIAGQKITDANLINVGLLDAELHYRYGTIEEQVTNLKIKVQWPEVTKEEFIEIAERRSVTNPLVFTIKTRQAGNADYMPLVIALMKTQIYEEFLANDHLRVDTNKLKMENIYSDEISPYVFSNDWFNEVKRFKAFGSAKYDGESTGPINIIFDVVRR